MTDSEELALAEAALQQLYGGGQSVTVLGRNFTRANMDSLTKRVDELRARIATKARGGIRLQRMVGRD